MGGVGLCLSLRSDRDLDAREGDEGGEVLEVLGEGGKSRSEKLEAALIVWFIAPIPDLSRGMCTHERAPGLDRPEARLQLGVKQMPDVNHFWPDL